MVGRGAKAMLSVINAASDKASKKEKPIQFDITAFVTYLISLMTADTGAFGITVLSMTSYCHIMHHITCLSGLLSVSHGGLTFRF